MKVKTEDLIDASLDWAVASIEALPKDRLHLLYGKPVIDRECLGRIDTLRCEFSSNWAQGGPIIERQEIGLRRNAPCSQGREWEASPSITAKGAGGKWGYGPTPLVAAMRCLVASQLGEEVDVPEELLK